MNRIFIVLSLCALLTACGSSTTGPTAPPPVNTALTSASSVSDFFGQMQVSYGYSAFTTTSAIYAGDFVSLTAVHAYFGQDDPIKGTYAAIPTATYPAQNARLTLGPRLSFLGPVAYSAVDLTNGLGAEGSYQTFWGLDVIGLKTAGNLTTVGILLATEGIVTLSGVPKYRVVQTMLGSVANTRISCGGSPTVTPSTIVICGTYTAHVVQVLDKTDSRVPPVGSDLSYSAIWLHQ